MARGTFLPVFPIPASFFHEDERPCYHVPPPRPSGFAASGSICPSMPLRPQGPSRSRRMRGAVREHAILAISTVEPKPRSSWGGRRGDRSQRTDTLSQPRRPQCRLWPLGIAEPWRQEVADPRARCSPSLAVSRALWSLGGRGSGPLTLRACPVLAVLGVSLPFARDTGPLRVIGAQRLPGAAPLVTLRAESPEAVLYRIKRRTGVCRCHAGCGLWYWRCGLYWV